MELRDIPEAPTQEWANEVINAMNERGDDEEKTDIQRAKELFPNLVSNKIQIAWVEDKYGQEVLVAKLNQSNAKLYTVVDGDGRFHDLPPTLEGALGSTSHTLDEVKYAFPNVDLAQIDIRKNGKLQVKHTTSTTWYNLYKEKGILNPKLPKQIKNALNISLNQELESVETELNESREEKTTQESEIARMKEEIERLTREKDQGWKEAREMGKSAAEAEKIRYSYDETIDKILKDKAALEESNKQLNVTIAGSLVDRERLLSTIDDQDNHINALEQTVEYLNRQLEEKQEIIDDINRTDEEREAARAEVERLEAKIAELRQEIEKAETRLGLTTKERVKRALLKYGLPTALAVGVAAVVGVIINMLKGTGNRIKKMGQVVKGVG